MFRPTKGGGASVWLSRRRGDAAADAGRPGHGAAQRPGAARAASGAGADGGRGRRRRMTCSPTWRRCSTRPTAGPPEAPADPVLARLLPDAYQDDPEAAGEFRKYTESSLREAKKYFAQTLLETLPPKGGRVKLTADQARDWLRALNDVRLMFGVRLEVTEDFEEQLTSLDPKDPRARGLRGLRLARRGPGVPGPRDTPGNPPRQFACADDLARALREDHRTRPQGPPGRGLRRDRRPGRQRRPTRFIPMQNAERSPTFYGSTRVSSSGSGARWTTRTRKPW